MNFKYFNKVLLLLFLGALVFANKQAFCMNGEGPQFGNIAQTGTEDTETININGELLMAIRHHDLEKVKEIICKNPELINSNLYYNLFGREGYWAPTINFAVEYSSLLIIKFLLENGAYLDLDLENSNGSTPLQLIIRKGYHEFNLPITQLLLQYGANPHNVELTTKEEEMEGEFPLLEDRHTAEILAKLGVDMSCEDQLIPTIKEIRSIIYDGDHDEYDFRSITERIKLIDFLINIGVDLNPCDCGIGTKHKILTNINKAIDEVNEFLPGERNFFQNTVKDLQSLLDKFYKNGANFGSTDKSLNTELLNLSTKLNNLTHSTDLKKLEENKAKQEEAAKNPESKPENKPEEKTIYQILKFDLKNILEKTIMCQGGIPEEIMDISKNIKDIIETNQSYDQITPYDKLMALSYLSGIKFVNQKGELLYLITDLEITKSLKHVPLNYDFFYDKGCKYLKCRVLEFRDEETKDINGKTASQAMSNYQKFTPVLFERLWQKLFKPKWTTSPDRQKNNLSIEPKEQLTSILFDNPKNEDLFFLGRIIPITKENKTNLYKSFRNNKFHKKFVNSCSLFTLLYCQPHEVSRNKDCSTSNIDILPFDIIAKIVSYTKGKLAKTENDPIFEVCTTIDDDASFLPSRNILSKEVANNKKEKTPKKTEYNQGDDIDISQEYGSYTPEENGTLFSNANHTYTVPENLDNNDTNYTVPENPDLYIDNLLENINNTEQENTEFDIHQDWTFH